MRTEIAFRLLRRRAAVDPLRDTTIAVAKIRGDGKREGIRAFIELRRHYLLRDRFGRPGKCHDGGKVEGLVKYARSTS